MKDTYPRPQFRRKQWQNLNGEWQFAFDDDNVGLKDKWYTKNDLPQAQTINVPFCVQSELSGIENKKDHPILWYKTSFTPNENNGRTILNIGAIDYISNLYINGNHVKTHKGGNVGFSVDITEYMIHEKVNTLHIRVFDDMHDIEIPRGKQFWKEESENIFYTRTSGIWQTIWLESIPTNYIKRIKVIPDILSNAVKIGYYLNLDGEADLKTTIKFNDEIVNENVKKVDKDYYEMVHYLGKNNDQGENRFWSPEHPNLYDIELTLTTNQVDTVQSYFGMRKIAVENGQIMLNNHPYYMRLVLDQGYYPESLMTAPNDEAIQRDITLTKKMGFNGVRKHQKIEEERYLYYADTMGLLVWEEMPSAYKFSSRAMQNLTDEWQRIIDRDYNHPSIVAWVPINESWGIPNLIASKREIHFLESLYHLTKAKDDTRLVISNDGWEHGTTDLLTVHDYEPSYIALKERYKDTQTILTSLPGHHLLLNQGFSYNGEPILVTEFGGISFQNDNQDGWGYSTATSVKDFEKRVKAVFDAMYDSPLVKGICYTQLTDIEQEINGLLTYHREPKISLEAIKKIVENH